MADQYKDWSELVVSELALEGYEDMWHPGELWLVREGAISWSGCSVLA